MKLTDDSNSRLMELISELTDAMVRLKMTGSLEVTHDKVDVEVCTDEWEYTAEAQDEFNNIYDQVEGFVYDILNIEI